MDTIKRRFTKPSNINALGYRSRSNDSLRDGRSGERILVGRDFLHPSRPGLGPTHSLLQWVPGQDRLGTKITLNTKLTAVLTGHGKTRAYLHRFNLRDDARCICGHNDQTMDHLLFHCDKTSTQREALIHQTIQQQNWMKFKPKRISKHTEVFCEFIDSIDFELLIQNEK